MKISLGNRSIHNTNYFSLLLVSSFACMLMHCLQKPVKNIEYLFITLHSTTLRHGSSSSQKLAILTRNLAVCALSCWVTAYKVISSFYLTAKDLNSGPHAGTANTPVTHWATSTTLLYTVFKNSPGCFKLATLNISASEQGIRKGC